MECLLAFHFLFACNLFLQIRLQILQVLSILQLSSILEILLHLQNFFLAQLLTLLSSNRIHSRTDSKHRRPVCRYNAGSRIRICHNIFQHFPFRRHIERRSCFIQQQNRRFRSSARAIESRCACPSENPPPRSFTILSIPSGSFSTNSHAHASFNASTISSSVASGFTFRIFSAIVPENIVFPCGT